MTISVKPRTLTCLLAGLGLFWIIGISCIVHSLAPTQLALHWVTSGLTAVPELKSFAIYLEIWNTETSTK